MHAPPASAQEFSAHDMRLHAAVTGFVAGHAVLPNAWFHAGWLLVGCLWCLRGLRMPPAAVFSPVWLFLGWMTLRSLFSGGAQSLSGAASAGLLVITLLLFWNARGILERCGRWNGHLAAAAALVSLTWHVCRLGVNFEDFRLQDILVHGGLNPVCTGLIFGFAALWLCALPMTRLTGLSALVLATAAFCTGSRGAMLALAVGHAVLLLVNGWRKGWRPLVLLAAAFSLYSMTGLLKPAGPGEQASPPAALAAPLQKALTRSNQGRLDIYRAGWSCLGTPARHLLGIGQWGTAREWQRWLEPSFMEIKGHLHSAFFSTYVHGGVIGAILLLLVVARAARAAAALATIGRAPWPALFSFGIAALAFDGESLAHLLTLPRFEALLFWLPVTMLLAHAPGCLPQAGQPHAGEGELRTPSVEHLQASLCGCLPRRAARQRDPATI